MWKIAVAFVAFAALGWHTGLVLPRHLGEEWWLTRARRRRG